MAAVTRPASRGEVIQAYLWIGAFALFSGIIEVAYQQWWWPIPAAFAFNLVLARTARVWGTPRAAWLAPLAFWGVGLCLVPGVWPAWPLVAAGVVGGVWPAARGK